MGKFLAWSKNQNVLRPCRWITVGNPNEAISAPRDAEWGERFFHLIDPDGHELSFARPLRSSGVTPLTSAIGCLNSTRCA